MANPSLSPDGRRVAMDVTDLKANNVDVWLMSTSVTRDGQRFLVNRYVKPEHVPPLTILLNTAPNPVLPQ